MINPFTDPYTKGQIDLTQRIAHAMMKGSTGKESMLNALKEISLIQDELLEKLTAFNKERKDNENT